MVFETDDFSRHPINNHSARAVLTLAMTEEPACPIDFDTNLGTSCVFIVLVVENESTPN